MRTVTIFAALAAAFVLDAGGAAQAARWCAGPHCGFSSYAQCQRAARATGRACHRQVAATLPAVRHGGANGLVDAPSRPAWASPYECYYDEGYGRYRACNAGGSVH
jgi:hypothetical protein